MSALSYLMIRDMETTIDRGNMEKFLASGCNGVHESVLRSYQILSKVKVLLEANTRQDLILELIELMESDAAIQGEDKQNG